MRTKISDEERELLDSLANSSKQWARIIIYDYAFKAAGGEELEEFHKEKADLFMRLMKCWEEEYDEVPFTKETNQE